jgi:hypothetical protein
MWNSCSHNTLPSYRMLHGSNLIVLGSTSLARASGLIYFILFVDPCIIVPFIKKIQQDETMYQNFIPYLYKAQHVSGDTPPIIRSLKLHWQPLVFYTWKVVWTCSWWTLSGTVCLTTSTSYTSKQPSTYKKPEGASAVLGSWWWAVCRPKHVELHMNME